MDAPYALIATADALAAQLERWRDTPWLAVDTEFVREDTYFARLCLVQLGDGAAQPQPSIDPQAVETALHRLPWEDDAVVQLENGWELRPRIAGQPTPVRMTVAAAELRFRRVVLSRPAAARLEVIAAEALRINAGIKHARLAWTGTQLVAESCLHAGQVHARWLQYAAQAVVAASMRASVPLELLAANDELAWRLAAVGYLAASSLGQSGEVERLRAVLTSARDRLQKQWQAAMGPYDARPDLKELLSSVEGGRAH